MVVVGGVPVAAAAAAVAAAVEDSQATSLNPEPWATQ